MSDKKVWRPFEEARVFTRSLKLRSKTEWFQYAKTDERPDDIPADPRYVYKNDGWINLRDWLGNEYLPFEEAREFARSLQLKGWVEWYQYRKTDERPDDIPAAPEHVYKNKGWKGWIDWLGDEDRKHTEESKRKISEAGKKSWRPFDEAREFARSLQLKNTREWEEYRNSGKKPDDIPSHPNVIYKNDWISWSDWLAL